MKDLNRIFLQPGHYTFSSLPDGAEGLVLSDLAEEKSILHIARDDQQAEKLCAAAKFFNPKATVIYFPAWDCLPYDRISPNPEIASQRLQVLAQLSGGGKFLVITTVNAALQRVPAKESLAFLHLQTGEEIKREKIISYLETTGYSRSATCTEHGEYAVRGGIIDIFPPGAGEAFRLDFLGDLLEQIRTFDPVTQITKGKREVLSLIPASEAAFTTETIINFKENYRRMFGAVTSDDPLFSAISEGRKYAGFEHWLPLFYDKLATIFDYLPGTTITLAHEVRLLVDKRLETINEYYKARRDFTEESYKALPPDALYLTGKEFSQILETSATADFFPFKMEGKNVINAGFDVAENYYLKSKELLQSPFEILKTDLGKKKQFYIACFSEGTKSRIEYLLKEHEIPCFDMSEWHQQSGGVGVFALPLGQGFQNAEMVCLSEQDLTGPKSLRSTRKKVLSEKFLAEVYNFVPGEILVHKEHGIGRFEGLEALVVSSSSNQRIPHECLKLTYDGGDKLYIPVENIDLLSRYGGADSVAALDKLGGVAWQSRKARLKERIKLAAEEIIKIAAERAMKSAESMTVSEGEYNEFCAQFPFTETDDQLRAITDVEGDLTSGKPMNRLICGDVGFGKTEVAMRAAFIALKSGSGNQVAIICPTTLLCRQHFKNFSSRFSGFGIEIRQLSRMVKPADALETRRKLKDGTIDIVIGTHTLLAKNIEFHKLALLVIDEEQHFGVAQKEHIKKLKSDIHVLTLTATPIPRTLQMSLTGIRDLSLIATPPVDRLAIRTYVMPYDAVVIREALLRERGRGGRTFYVVPRIKDLDQAAGQLKHIVPELKIVIAHGQLKPAELDKLMNDFYDGKYDVLVSTSIIESGIDIPAANTIIVHRSDMFGLAQLYQLRGRVGRSNVRAYAYFTLKHGRIITKNATKRLEVMQKLDALGAGFTLATYDMDIRGFGNLLGDEQSGNIKEVGVELYEQMLAEAIEGLKAHKEPIAEKNFSPQINIGIPVLIPENYIADLSLRLGFYRRIAAVETPEELQEIAAEIADRFGALPSEVEHLLKVIEIKQLCKAAGIEKLDAGPKGVILAFHGNKFARPESLIRFISENQNTVKLRADHRLVFTAEGWENLSARIKGIRNSIETVTRLAA